MNDIHYTEQSCSCVIAAPYLYIVTRDTELVGELFDYGPIPAISMETQRWILAPNMLKRFLNDPMFLNSRISYPALLKVLTPYESSMDEYVCVIIEFAGTHEELVGAMRIPF